MWIFLYVFPQFVGNKSVRITGVYILAENPKLFLTPYFSRSKFFQDYRDARLLRRKFFCYLGSIFTILLVNQGFWINKGRNSLKFPEKNSSKQGKIGKFSPLRGFRSHILPGFSKNSKIIPPPEGGGCFPQEYRSMTNQEQNRNKATVNW